MQSLLNAVTAIFEFMYEGFYIDLGWLGEFVKIIVEGVGIVGVGIIVFTLILKAITTPFDVYQRIKMRKQTLIMRDMQDDLKKLQKQYANDKQMYNQKMMELQKKNGYSVFGACLPMILSLVILIIAVNAFQSYSQYANLDIYRNMAAEYNATVREYAAQGEDYSLDQIAAWENGVFTDGDLTYTAQTVEGVTIVTVTSSNENIFINYKYDTKDFNRTYEIDCDKLYAKESAAIDAIMQERNVELDSACWQYFDDKGAISAAKWFREENDPGFLWIKNVWYPDVSYASPVQDYESFAQTFNEEIFSYEWEGAKGNIAQVLNENNYNRLTAQLNEEKEQANGYYILIVLTIGLMVLSQFLSMKSQKETNQYQTVDGQGAKTQKWMMIFMPMIYAITGFMWTAAFSIYISISSIIGILVTLLSNLIIGRVFKKKEEEAIKKRYSRELPWQKDKQDKRK